MNRIFRRRWTAVFTLCAAVLAGVLLLSRNSSGGGPPGQQVATFLCDARGAGGRRVLRGPGNAIPILKAEDAPAAAEPDVGTFPLRVLNVELRVPRDVSNVSVCDQSDIYGYPYWTVILRTPRHTFTRGIHSRPSSLFRDVLRGRDIPKLAERMAKETNLSSAEAAQRLRRARESVLALSDEGMLRHVLAADAKVLRRTREWDKAMELCLSLLARDWVWDAGEPCYTLARRGETVYVVYSRQSTRDYSLFFIAAFGEDGAKIWDADISSRPPSEGGDTVEFVRQVLGGTDATSQPVAAPPSTSTAPGARRPPLRGLGGQIP